MPSLPLTSSEPVRHAECLGWHLELLPQRGYEAAYRAERPVIGFAFDGQRGHHAFDSDRIVPFLARPNSLAFVPAGSEVFSCSPLGGEYLRVVPPPGLAPARQGFTGAPHPQAVEAAHALRRLLLAGETSAGLATAGMEAWLWQLRGVAGEVADGSAAAGRAAHWMTVARLKRLDALIEARMAEPGLDVPTLAAELGLSEGFFNRALRAAVGRTPHRYLIERRLARARALLARPGLNLLDVALLCGFSSHAHLSGAFRQYLGVTPRRLRQALR